MNKIFLLSAILVSACAELDPYFDIAQDYINLRDAVEMDRKCLEDPNCYSVDGGWVIVDEIGHKTFIRDESLKDGSVN